MSGPQDYDRKYLRSMPGLCKVACLLCSFIGFLCIVCGPVRVSNFRGSFYLAVVSIGFVTTAALLLARYLRMWQRQFCRCDPTLWSLAVHSSLALAYFTASGLVLSLDIAAYTAAAVSSKRKVLPAGNPTEIETNLGQDIPPKSIRIWGSLARPEKLSYGIFFGLTAFSINGLEAYGNYRRSRQREVATQTI
ncbi:hypothetical protein M5D96_013296 [Drosophila gunungcola]|uniref:MARVEL domain-containing protein n=1 Tax=Drosophila gunungcola TaxID=103775 RepID=A0A9Q0BJQ9_9MUSC|nr:hypothetical protein M5D96_013296 [Drosophila gunungcola]